MQQIFFTEEEAHLYFHCVYENRNLSNSKKNRLLEDINLLKDQFSIKLDLILLKEMIDLFNGFQFHYELKRITKGNAILNKSILSKLQKGYFSILKDDA